MDKKTTDEEIEKTDEEVENFDIDNLLNEEENSPIEEVTEESPKEEKKKNKGRSKETIKKKDASEPSVEVAQIQKELSNMEWEAYTQPAFDGFQNIKTGEVIGDKEAIRRTLCYAQEAARNSR